MINIHNMIRNVKKKCDVCKKTFGSQKSVRKHLKNCPPKRFSCDICHKSYSQKSDAISHQKKHASQPSLHKCSKCHQEFMTLKQLRIHSEQIHQN